MDIHGFSVISEPSQIPPTTDDDGRVISDGFTTTVSDAVGVIRGPFHTVKEAIDCAHAWHAEVEATEKASS